MESARYDEATCTLSVEHQAMQYNLPAIGDIADSAPGGSDGDAASIDPNDTVTETVTAWVFQQERSCMS